jgi:hypothetical protein
MSVYKVSIVKSEGQRPLGKKRCRTDDITKMDAGEIGWVGRDWTHRTQDRGQWGGDSCVHGNENSGSTKCWEYFKWLSNC